MELDERSQLGEELARVITQFWKMDRKKGPYRGINQSELTLLINLKFLNIPSPKGIKVSDLSSRLCITSAAVTQVINSLEEKGYVERLADPKDRRVVLVALTSMGEDLIKLAYKDHIGFLSGLVGYLGEKDSKELIRLLSMALTYIQEKRRERK